VALVARWVMRELAGPLFPFHFLILLVFLFFFVVHALPVRVVVQTEYLKSYKYVESHAGMNRGVEEHRASSWRGVVLGFLGALVLVLSMYVRSSCWYV
jgi:hypothetical protein